VVVQSTQGWGNLDLREVWQYRELLWFLTLRDIKGRYRQMALGGLWIIIKPVASMAMFSLIFGELAKLPSDGVPYPVFTFTAILPWTYFASATGGSVGSLRGRMGMISKVYFPRLIVPGSAVIAPLLDLVVGSAVLFGLMVYFGFVPTIAALAIPLYLLLALALALGLGLWSSAIEVRFRDFSYALTYGLQVWMYLTPVAYTATLIPERWQLVYQLNPLYWVVEGFRWGLLDKGNGPEPLMLVPIGGVLALLLSGIYVFRRNERSVVDLA
jgi:lipopolysaccharide transport system permease protein